MPWIATVVSAVPNIQTGFLDITVEFANSGQPKVVRTLSGNSLAQADVKQFISTNIANLQSRDTAVAAVQSIVGQSFGS